MNDPGEAFSVVLKAVRAVFPYVQTYHGPNGEIAFVIPTQDGLPEIRSTVSPYMMTASADPWVIGMMVAERLTVDIARQRVLQAKELDKAVKKVAPPPVPPLPAVQWIMSPDLPATSHHSTVTALSELAPALNSVMANCPAPSKPSGGCASGSLAVMIQHLNDHHRWTREQIADWLDGPDFAEVDLVLNHAASSGD